MNISLKTWSLNQKLAGGAAVLGFLAIFAGSPYTGASATVDSKDLAVLVQREVDHVKPVELADWIIQGKVDFRLIDLRDAKDYAEYHIPMAENVPLPELSSHGLARNETIILYSDGGIHSAQAWFLLKAQKYRGVYILLGGLEEWKDSVLFPSIAQNAGPEERAEFEKMKEVSKFFGGSPRTGTTGGTEVQAALPKLEMPAPVAVPRGTKKKRKEGC